MGSKWEGLEAKKEVIYIKKTVAVIAMLMAVLFSVVVKAGESDRVIQTTTVAADKVTTAAETTTIIETTAELTTTTVETTTVVETEPANYTDKPVIGRYFEPNRVHITQEEYEVICCVVMREAGADYGHVEGCYAVAQCILEGMLQENESATTLLTHYWYKPQDALRRAANTPPNQKTRDAVYKVFYEGYGVTSRPIAIYYSPANMTNGWSEYHESQIFVFSIDGNRFFEKR